MNSEIATPIHTIDVFCDCSNAYEVKTYTSPKTFLVEKASNRVFTYIKETFTIQTNLILSGLPLFSSITTPGDLKLWQPCHSYKESNYAQLDCHRMTAETAQFISINTHYTAISSLYGSMHVFNNSGTCEQEWNGHTNLITSLQSDENRFYTGSLDGKIKVWHPSHADASATLSFAPVTCMKLLSGAKLAVGSDHAILQVWDLTANKVEYVWKDHQHALACLAYADGLLISVSLDGAIFMRDIRQNKLIKAMKLTDTTQTCQPADLYYDQRTLVLATRSGLIKIWDLANQCLKTIQLSDKSLHDYQLCMQGSHLLCASKHAIHVIKPS